MVFPGVLRDPGDKLLSTIASARRCPGSVAPAFCRASRSRCAMMSGSVVAIGLILKSREHIERRYSSARALSSPHDAVQRRKPQHRPRLVAGEELTPLDVGAQLRAGVDPERIVPLAVDEKRLVVPFMDQSSSELLEMQLLNQRLPGRGNDVTFRRRCIARPAPRSWSRSRPARNARRMPILA